MLFEHQSRRPDVDPTATVAPTAVLSGDIRVGPGCRILHGAVLTAQGGPVTLGSRCIVMENAVLRGTARHPLAVGEDVLIGPRAYLTGCVVEDASFLATGATIFNGAVIGARSEVRINGVVHLLTELDSDSTVPIGWVAVGRPAAILPPGAHEEIWERQEPLDFPREIFGVERPGPGESIMPEVAERYGRYLALHDGDRRVD
ncbi:MAG: gamma carbonic anhydrase family protein [Gemmatimonadetes bacterium]|nr:gamma carbonic anhydrase family protein [Gemmatimonadota bacterium]NIR80794.1 gamma carbonic anhydrase family protein [Gemmatimonadota bacterium]NIT89614.1 gamma carbonic anhydrase family protein [Gemmatimonadota bacterium]NIU33394.1 gamma carbonic anhydrase family protein [Gemmatimonadota bacterium]NIU37686.1 gamma carbonic anhydrase family protein [Gemmatimonadota bacterium]